MDAPVISARGLVLAGEARDRLADVSLDVAAGTVVGIIGPNGAGKSTLLGILAGVEKRWRGAVTVLGRYVQDWDRLAYAREVAYLPQEFHCQWALTVENLVTMGAERGRSFGWPSLPVAAVDPGWVYAAFDLEPLRRRIFNTLSGGEKARALLAASVAARPCILLADEPVANLDPLHQLEAMGRLRGLASDGTAVVIVLHDLTIAARFCDVLVLLDRGQVACAGTPDAVLQPEWLARVYGVRAVFGRHEGANYVLPWARVDTMPTAPEATS